LHSDEHRASGSFKPAQQSGQAFLFDGSDANVQLRKRLCVRGIRKEPMEKQCDTLLGDGKTQESRRVPRPSPAKDSVDPNADLEAQALATQLMILADDGCVLFPEDGREDRGS